jgi:hypothetical protein
MTEENLETIILGHIAKELKDEIQIGRQVNLAKTIMQALRKHEVVGRSEQLLCPICSSDNIDAEFNHYNFCRDCNHDWAK